MFEKYENKKNEKISEYSTIKIGGIAKWIVYPKNITELREVISISKEKNIKFFVIGNCSNILFDDDGFDGVLISLKNFNRIQKNDEYITIGAGFNLFALNVSLAKYGLSGLEWSYGIPGTIGGLVFMNGGSFSHEICEFVDEILILDENQKLKKLKKEEINFQYRTSNLEKCVVLSIKLKLRHEKTESVCKKMKECYQEKLKLQPCDKPSLGSVFKHIQKDGEIIYPAKVIDELNMKGMSVGGAQISTKHAGFIVNTGNATCNDVKKLILHIKKKFEEKDMHLEDEIVILGK